MLQQYYETQKSKFEVFYTVITVTDCVCIVFQIFLNNFYKNFKEL